MRDPDMLAGPSARVSEHLRDDSEGVIGILVIAAVLAFRQLHLCARQFLVWDFAQDMSEYVQSRPPLIVGMDHIPRRPRGVGSEEHLVACPRVIVPAGIGFEIHVGQLPDLAPVIDARLEPSRLLFGADLQPILQENYARVDYGLLDPG